MQFKLELNDYRVKVSLGYPADERKKQQEVSVDFQIRFHEMPQACETDELEDAICYDKITQQIKQFCQNQSFKLIEHFGFMLYEALDESFTEMETLALRITKKPAIDNLQGGASFIVGDWQ